MSEYLSSKNKELIQKSFNGAFIDDILWIYKESNDCISNLILRYQSTNKTEFFLSDNELEIVNLELKNNYHILIKTILHNFVAHSKESNKSQLMNCCEEYINDYFNNVDKINGGIPAHNMSVIIKLTIDVFPKYKNNITNILFNKITNGRSGVIRYLSITDYFLRDEKLINIFNPSQYEDIYNKYLVDIADSINIYFYLDIYERYYEYVVENNKILKGDLLKNIVIL